KQKTPCSRRDNSIPACDKASVAATRRAQLILQAKSARSKDEPGASAEENTARPAARHRALQRGCCVSTQGRANGSKRSTASWAERSGMRLDLPARSICPETRAVARSTAIRQQCQKRRTQLNTSPP